MKSLSDKLELLKRSPPDLLRGARRGLEKEALRTTHQGKIAQTPHPAELGSALTHPCITTDFSEALLEFITPPSESIKAMLGWMDDIHRYSCNTLSQHNEWLWMASMPCVIDGEDAIPLAYYGTSNSAQMKYLYRKGLGYRYGRTMQTIAGIHYNYSLPDEFWMTLQNLEGAQGSSLCDYRTRRYFDLIRNFRRYFWLLLYLFGAAPAICPTFVKNRRHSLQNLGNHSLYYPFATSLRMGELGYQSQAQDKLIVDYNSLDGYVHSLLSALTTSHPAYEEIGVCQQGEYRQLNTNLLQIENEFYSTIRPKRTTKRGETPLKALKEKGVEYIEVRSIDINPFHPLGIDSVQAHFVEAFLLFCLLEESPPTSPEEYRQIAENQHNVVNRGRDPSLEVYCHATPVNLRSCAHELLEKISAVAVWADGGNDDTNHNDAVRIQYEKLLDETLTPSSQMLDIMQEKQQSYFRMVWDLSKQHAADFLARPLPPEKQNYFEKLAQQSLIDQQQLEAADSISFEQYLKNYFDQYK